MRLRLRRRRVPDRVLVYRDTEGRWRWRRFSPRGNLPDLIVADSGQGYSRRHDAKRAALAKNPGLTVTVASPPKAEERRS